MKEMQRYIEKRLFVYQNFNDLTKEKIEAKYIYLSLECFDKLFAEDPDDLEMLQYGIYLFKGIELVRVVKSGFFVEFGQ
jgi:hypothetical protein